MSTCYHNTCDVGNSKMRTHAVVHLGFPSQKQSKIVFEALQPETRTISTHRSRASIKGRGKTLIIHFEAEDTSALRAAINSFLRWVLLMKAVLNSVDKLQFDDK
jgi:tRNA threonylcarbamoyladenosine modification (KEOPS) complex  Pcc1 subunit